MTHEFDGFKRLLDSAEMDLLSRRFKRHVQDYAKDNGFELCAEVC